MKNIPTKYNHNLPKKITGSYTDDYDISYIHDIIINTLTLEKNNIPELNKELEILKKSSLKLHTFNNKKEINEAMDKIEKEINMIKSNSRLIEYKSLATTLIEKYINLKINDGSVNERLKVINQYLKIAKKYINIQVNRVVVNKNACMNCKASLDNGNISIYGVLKCPECNNEHHDIISIKHMEHFKTHSNTENDMENFDKALMRYQGLQNNPPKNLYSKLDVYFNQRGLPSAEYIKSLPYNERGKKGNVNKEMLCTALSAIGYASYYEDVNLIGHIYWDWKLPDLTLLKETIMRHYIITQKNFYKIPIDVRDRISSLGTQFRLFKHLQLVGHICYVDDFKIAENQDSIQNHNRIWKLMCELSDDPEIYYIE